MNAHCIFLILMKFPNCKMHANERKQTETLLNAQKRIGRGRADILKIII
jgi:hypothetical protein